VANHVLRNGRIVHTYHGAETPGMFQTRAQAARFFLGLIVLPLIAVVLLTLA